MHPSSPPSRCRQTHPWLALSILAIVLAATPLTAAQPSALSPGQPASKHAVRHDPFHGLFIVPDHSTGPEAKKGRSVNVPYFVEHLIPHSPSQSVHPGHATHPSHASHASSPRQSIGIHEGHDHALHKPGHCRVGAQFISYQTLYTYSTAQTYVVPPNCGVSSR
ncbi:hypothetical protein EDD21DRAFT_98904 [Dissophora ornata]|nr:hypothetical protein EDD21DRAFT_98904 [Dissophora ornata]